METITKEGAIQYFNDHKEDLIELCTKFGLRFPYEDRDTLMTYYKSLKGKVERLQKRHYADPQNEVLSNLYKKAFSDLLGLENTYHLFDMSFNLESEKYWLPKEYDTNLHDIFEFRKRMYNTQAIVEDMELDAIISDDEYNTWEKYGGQDGMYDNFPICITYKSIEKSYDSVNENYIEGDTNPYYNTKVFHYSTEVVRSYCLDGNGGVAIIETRNSTKFDDGSSQTLIGHQIVTLGEDDANHFIHSRRIYELYGYSSDSKEFLKCLDLAINEFTNFIKNENKEKC